MENKNMENNENTDSRSKWSQSIYSADSVENLPEFIDVIKSGNLCEALGAMIEEYCDFSTIHGVRYLGERKRSWIEKLFWLIIFSVSIYFCTSLIGDAWSKWNESPVLINFNDKATSIWKIPLPTFTICPDNKINSSVFNFTEISEFGLSNVSEINYWITELKQYMDVSLQVCDSSKTSDLAKYFYENFEGDIFETFRKLTPSINDIIGYFEFEGQDETDPTKYIDLVITELGICFAFNMIQLKDIYRTNVISNDLIFTPKQDRSTKWTLEKGYEGDAVKERYPFRTFSTGIELGLKVLLYGIISDIDPLCNGVDNGFKFAISAPGDVPQLSRQFFSVSFENEVMVDIRPDLLTTSESARDYSPKLRKCYFDDEKYLRFFKKYSKANCELECLTNFTLKKCGCARFNMPRLQTTKICGASKTSCYLDAKKELLEYAFQNLMNETYKIPEADCNCIPSCTSLTYSVSVTQAPVSVAAIEDGQYASIFKIYFKEKRFWSYKRTKIYGVIEFVSDVGGLLGLCMGVSILSCIEIIYFITIRLCGNIKLRYFSTTVQTIQRRISDAYIDMQDVQHHFKTKNDEKAA